MRFTGPLNSGTVCGELLSETPLFAVSFCPKRHFFGELLSGELLSSEHLSRELLSSELLSRELLFYTRILRPIPINFVLLKKICSSFVPDFFE